VVRDTQMVINGEAVNVQRYETQANGRDGVSQGVELYGQYTFDFGFGVQANYTYNDTNLASIVLDGQEIGSSPLVGSAKNQANVTVFYENDKFLARASFNRRGQVVGGLNNGLTVYTEPYDQLDLNVAYNLTPDWTLTASVINATKSEQRVHLGSDSQGTPDLQYLCRPPAVLRRYLEVLRQHRVARARPVQPTPRPGGDVPPRQPRWYRWLPFFVGALPVVQPGA
jgi:TonB-dependent receptor